MENYFQAENDHQMLFESIIEDLLRAELGYEADGALIIWEFYLWEPGH